MGAVMEITTRLPEKLEGSINQTQALQTLLALRHRQDLRHDADHGRRRQSLRQVRLLGERQLSEQPQPAAELRHQPPRFRPAPPAATPTRTSSAPPPTCSARPGCCTPAWRTRSSRPRTTSRRRFAPPTRSATGRTTPTRASSRTPTASGQPTYAGQAGFASGFYNLRQEHHAHSLSIRSDTQRRLGFRGRRHAVPLRHRQAAHADDARRRPARRSAAPGRVAVLDGTGWYTLDAERRRGAAAARAPHGQLRRARRPLHARQHRRTTRPTGRPAARTPACPPRATARRDTQARLGAGQLVGHARAQAHRRRALRELESASTATTSTARPRCTSRR